MRKRIVSAACLLVVGIALFPIQSPAALVADVCRSDLNSDQAVDISDYSLLTAHLFQVNPANAKIDMNSDGLVDLSDYSLFAESFVIGVEQCGTTTPPTPSQNLLQNPGFESGTGSWTNLPAGAITTTHKHSGNNAVKIGSDQLAYQGWLAVTPGKQYVATGWFRWEQFGGEGWGTDKFAITNNSFQTVTEITGLASKYEKGIWHKLALTFTAQTSQVRLNFGLFGPKASAEFYFDDFTFAEKTANTPPSLSISADKLTGTAPLTVNFSSTANDADGGVALYRWEFGDGGESRSLNPNYKFIKKGSYNVKLTVFDNDGARTEKQVSIQVTDSSAPTLQVTSHTGDSATVTQPSIALAGSATAASGTVSSVIWDNVHTGQAGKFSTTATAATNWAGQIPLKLGTNEVLLTVADSSGRIETKRIVINRPATAPVIGTLTPNASQVKVYEKYEVQFPVDTVAKYPMFRYEENVPYGIEPKAGVTVEGIFTSPSGKVLRQPGFYFTQTEKTGSIFTETNHSAWAIRFSPQEVGQYAVKIKVTDASGTVEKQAANFTAVAATKKGFIKVSQQDPRYFEYSDGSLYWPTGPAWATGSGEKGILTLDRPWLGGRGIYSTNWARWQSTAESFGNEGLGSHLEFSQHYPSSELSQHLHYPAGWRLSMGWLDDNYKAKFKTNTNYQVKLRAKLIDVTGPRDAGQNYGLVVKQHDWPGNTFEQDGRSLPSMIPHTNGSKDWHTILTTYRTGGTDRPFMSIYLENVTGGQVYIDELSIREIRADGSLGGELVRNPKADMHTYIEQRPAAGVDADLAVQEANGSFWKVVVHDKNDRIQERLSSYGVFVTDGDGYYQPKGTKARWLLEQWWRYTAARWGYSTAIHSWELNNEGPPDDGTGSHAATAQDFAKIMHESDAHPHLATTSFWCCWQPTFWGNKLKFPDIDYADIHQYTEGSASQYDMAKWSLDMSSQVYNSNIGRPTMRAETGISTNFAASAELSTANAGVWYHNLLWAGLAEGAMSDPGYWFSEHLTKINALQIAKPFVNFIDSTDLNKGGYGPLNSTSTNTQIRVIGQKNLPKDKAYIWFQNINHTWKKVKDGVNIPPQSGQVSVTMRANTAYKLEWWNTITGQISKTEVINADGSGKLTIPLNNLPDDIALKVNKN